MQKTRNIFLQKFKKLHSSSHNKLTLILYVLFEISKMEHSKMQKAKKHKNKFQKFPIKTVLLRPCGYLCSHICEKQGRASAQSSVPKKAIFHIQVKTLSNFFARKSFFAFLILRKKLKKT